MAGFTQETATARLARLLTMVPWLVNRQGIDVQQAADDLGVSVEQLEADLNLLFLCGYGQMPDELIEADSEGGKVFVGNADTIARPLRLGVDEAVTLMVGLARCARCPAWPPATPSTVPWPSSRTPRFGRRAREPRAGRDGRRGVAPRSSPAPAGHRRPSPGAPALPRARP